MKTWQAVSLGVIVGLLLSGLILLLVLPQRGEPIQLATSTPDARAQPTPTPDTIEVYVIGAVANPGVYVLSAGSRVHEAVTSAGGAAADADLERVNLSAFLADGQRLYLPRVGELCRRKILPACQAARTRAHSWSTSTAPMRKP